MKFSEVVAQTLAWLQRDGRVSYRALRLEFDLTEDVLDALKEELIEVKELAVDKDGKMLVWVGERGNEETAKRGKGEEGLASSVQSLESEQVQGPRSKVQSQETQSPTPSPQPLAAERRQLTVMFIDLVGSTTLSQQLDPEDYHARVVAYQTVCHQVIARYEGHVAQYLGDGVLVYFGYPTAHEEDAVRAVRAGLEIIEALRKQVPSPVAGEVSSSPSPSTGEGRGKGEKDQHSQTTLHPDLLPQGEKELRRLQVRIGIHTGPVVVGEIGSSERREMLALGETPNLAARIQGQAHPDEVVISAATYRLAEGFFVCEDHGQPQLKGVTTPLTLYRIIKESEAQSRFEVAVGRGLTPLVGREEESGLLHKRWEQAKTGEGQVMLLSGEAGIGKSRLVQEFKTAVTQAGATRIEFRCSPYSQNSAYYPIIDHLQRLLHFHREETPQAKLTKLQQTLAQYRFPQADTLPLVAALLSLPHPEGAPPITLSPQKQKQKTLEALVAWIVEEAEKAPVYCAWEDLHWADPSTLELLTLFLDQVPTARLWALLTFRPEFSPPWGNLTPQSNDAEPLRAHSGRDDGRESHRR